MRRYKSTEPKYIVPRGPHYVVAVDLGKRKCGVAVALVDPTTDADDSFVLGSRTIHCPPDDCTALAMAHAVVDAAYAMGIERFQAYEWVWVCEWPVKYKDKTKYHKAIDALQKVGKAIRPRWDEKYRPSDWKGNVPKSANHSRVDRALYDEEKRDLPPRTEHDAWDALGILLFAIARTRRGGSKI